MTDKTDIATSVIGMTQDEAQKAIESAGLPWRVRFRDGVPLNGTSDYNMSRLNLSIEGNKVTGVSYG